MNWDDLRFFLAVARRGTLTRAARDLGVTHTTVARRLAALQQGVGVRLFEKLPDRYALTAAGEDILSIAEAMEERAQAVDRQLLGRDARLSGPLRVTTVDMLASVHARDFAAFIQQYPGVELEVSVQTAVLNLARREADVAIRATLSSPPDNLVGRKAGRWEYALYGARSLVDEVRAGASGDPPLGAYPWLAWDERLGARVTERWMASHVPGARIACRVDATSLMIAHVRAGTGIAFLPEVIAQQHDELVALRPREPGFGMDIWVLTHPDLRHTARVTAFTEHISSAIRGRINAGERGELRAAG